MYKKYGEFEPVNVKIVENENDSGFLDCKENEVYVEWDEYFEPFGLFSGDSHHFAYCTKNYSKKGTYIFISGRRYYLNSDGTFSSSFDMRILSICKKIDECLKKIVTNKYLTLCRKEEILKTIVEMAYQYIHDLYREEEL